MLALKIFGTIVGIYAGVKFSGVAIDWIRVTIDGLRPPKNRDPFE